MYEECVTPVFGIPKIDPKCHPLRKSAHGNWIWRLQKIYFFAFFKTHSPLSLSPRCGVVVW
jgi:hypothetical protein